MSQDWTPPPAAGAPDKVPNYLIPAIISAICCLPLGIVSIIFAAQVNKKVQMGDIAGAMNASKKAKLFSYIGIIGGIVVWGLQMIFGFGIVGLSLMGNS